MGEKLCKAEEKGEHRQYVHNYSAVRQSGDRGSAGYLSEHRDEQARVKQIRLRWGSWAGFDSR